MATWAQIGFQNSASPLMEQLIFFHDHALLILILITTLVGYFMISLVTNKFVNRYLLDGQMIEIIWTVLPAVILIILALPSLRLLYLIDETTEPSLTLKTVGHQWYWSYEYSDFNDIEFDSYMTPTNNLQQQEFRLLEVDNRVILPYLTQIRLLVTAADVIHSWTIPSLGIKADAVPGRLNQLNVFFNRPGVFYGQCSEICGANHSFMPISVEAITPTDFLTWIKSF
ncbi:cytochrome c oxidase subunit II (mitochondrion) [Daphnia magna]|uniref:Cytochrome c oxidase subunit 2 n=2 Tax=Daphnia magna TaxID=35525 RepID=A0A0A0S1N0_9CRUS|nr:cytochrome c oxidase subunit II [Daphnia magna]AIW06376.1 cytochrome c oxidase subunit II [Daphnia magna]AKC58389.1 cytochrome oxidase subunit II [Daphnia magna]AYE40656.1 cytochrome c oxidase subunit 2 [Daphnia magna]AYE40812.1 cytochrome c oxidase subunit 2 [Daphnia magna]AYE40825.1 cytochrome c oxidase subunit 2 [Daphnia magna]